MTEQLQEIKFDNLNYDALQDWCEDFTHWNFVQDEMADKGIQNTMVDNRVKIAIIHLKMELDKLSYGEPETPEEMEARMKNKKNVQ